MGDCLVCGKDVARLPAACPHCWSKEIIAERDRLCADLDKARAEIVALREAWRAIYRDSHEPRCINNECACGLFERQMAARKLLDGDK